MIFVKLYCTIVPFVHNHFFYIALLEAYEPLINNMKLLVTIFLDIAY